MHLHHRGCTLVLRYELEESTAIQGIKLGKLQTCPPELRRNLRLEPVCDDLGAVNTRQATRASSVLMEKDKKGALLIVYVPTLMLTRVPSQALGVIFAAYRAAATESFKVGDQRPVDLDYSFVL
jgi:hypothetical protein